MTVGTDPSRGRFWEMTEDRKYLLYRVGAHAAWWTALIWTVVLVKTNVTHAPGDPRSSFQTVSGVGILILIGVAIAAGSALSRLTLASTIADVFEAGIKVATVLQTNVSNSACMVETDKEGVIQDVEHPNIIGWDHDSLMGKNLDILIPDRLLRNYQETFKAFQEGGSEGHATGSTVNTPVLTQDGSEVCMRLSLARLGDTLLGTLAPIDESDCGEETR